jgi:23S rRNA (adenine1618-N6)-methyltransferase
MQPEKREHPAEKDNLHPRSKHRERYDLQQLAAALPALAPYVKVNDYGDESIDFFDPQAVRLLNAALIKHHYGVGDWVFPPNYLCPPIPGRADYLHYLADLLATSNGGKIPRGKGIVGLDIGVGASGIYPLLGNVLYGWSFVGTDIDSLAIGSARKIVAANPALTDKISLRIQKEKNAIFRGVVAAGEYFDFAICNPPFHASAAEAQALARRKLKNLGRKKADQATLNFGGQSHELWCEGGEERFLADMVRESAVFATSCFWFTSLVSQESHLPAIYKVLDKFKAYDVQTIPMGQGNKTSRIIAWTFLNEKQQKAWAALRWKG